MQRDMHVVPATVQARRMIPQLEEDFFHMERSGQGLNEDGRADGIVSHMNVRLGEEEDIIPKTCFEVMLHFREVEIRTGAALDEFMGIVEEIQCKVKE